MMLPEEFIPVPAYTMPSDKDGEAWLIGCVLSKPEIMCELSFLQADDFYQHTHREIWRACMDLHGNSEKITPFAIRDTLDAKTQELFEGGVVKYLVAAMSASIVIFDIIELARKLLDMSSRRALIEACEATITSATLMSHPLEESAGNLMVEVERLSSSDPLSEFKTRSQVMEDILANLKDDRKPMSTGMPRLDNAMGGGLFPGKSYGFAAKKKMGKTMLAGTVSGNLEKQGIRHLFICAEMSPEEIEQRISSRELGCYPSAFRSEYSQNPAFLQRLKSLSAKQSFGIYKNAPGLTFDQLKRTCRNAVERAKVQGIIIDYWQLVGGKERGQSDASHYDAVAQWIADFGRKHGVWMFVLAQINQEGNTRGGEGIRLAFDQVYQLRAPEDDPSRSGRYLEMMDTRYTSWLNVGTENQPGYLLHEKGLYFEEQPG